MMSKLVILAACLLSVAPAQDPSLFGEEEDEPLPAYVVSAECLFAGPGLSTAEYGSESGLTFVRLGHVGFERNRVRGGLALLDVAGAGSFLLPVTAGYTIYERPVPYAGSIYANVPEVYSLYAKVPEVYVEASGAFISTFIGGATQPPGISFRGTLELVCSVDGYGFGASVAAGCYYFNRESWTGGGSELGLYVAARLHLLRLRWGWE